MPRLWEPAVTYLFGEPLAGVADHRPHIRILFDEARRVFTAQAQHIFSDQHLAVAGR